MESQFGSGLLLEGSHPCIKASRLQVNPEAMHIARTVLGTVGRKARQGVRSVRKKTWLISFLILSLLVLADGQNLISWNSRSSVQDSPEDAGLARIVLDVQYRLSR